MPEADALQIHIDLRQKQPLAEQIQEELRRIIGAGSLLPGAPLPTVRQLASQLRVNFNTVARAYRALDIEGLITTRQGRGTFVATTLWDTVKQPVPNEWLDQEIERIIIRMELAGFPRAETLAAFAQALNKEQKDSSAAQPIQPARIRARQKSTASHRAAKKGLQFPARKRQVRKITRRLSRGFR